MALETAGESDVVITASYLPGGQFISDEILDLAEIKLSDFSRLLAQARRQFQAWLNATFPQEEQVI